MTIYLHFDNFNIEYNAGWEDENLKNHVLLLFSLIFMSAMLISCGNGEQLTNDMSEDDANEIFQLEELSDHSLRIKSYTGTGKSIAVPERIGGKTVSEIGTGAFKNSDVEKITIPATVETIGSWAFFNLKKCTEVTIGNKMALKSDDIFSQCPNLKKVNTEGEGTIVWFLGNSLTAEGNLDMYFQDVCDQKGEKVIHYTNTGDGYTLGDHFSDFSGTAPETAYLTADVILIQPLYIEYDSEYVNDLRSLCRDDAKIYSLGTIYTRYNDYQLIQKEWETPLDGFTPGGDICDDLIQKKILNFYDIQSQDEVHPTYLNGFISGVSIYKELFSKPVTDIDHKKVSYSLDDFIPGDTDGEKSKKIQEILTEIEQFDRDEYQKSGRASYDYSIKIKRG